MKCEWKIIGEGLKKTWKERNKETIRPKRVKGRRWLRESKNSIWFRSIVGLSQRKEYYSQFRPTI